MDLVHRTVVRRTVSRLSVGWSDSILGVVLNAIVTS